MENVNQFIYKFTKTFDSVTVIICVFDFVKRQYFYDCALKKERLKMKLEEIYKIIAAISI